MKRVLFVLLFATAGIAIGAPKVGSTVTIRVLSAKVMKGPKFIGSTAGSVARGDQLTVAEVKGDWYRVEGSSTGWIHKSNITEGKVALSSTPGGQGGKVNQEEVELAGRGFTPEVEKKYRDKNPNLDFSHVDAIEKTSIDPAELETFVADGKLQ
jgi:uncharacterized protein YgiM (DUF1202 family)